jgi:hypothetical protein
MVLCHSKTPFTSFGCQGQTLGRGRRRCVELRVFAQVSCQTPESDLSNLDCSGVVALAKILAMEIPRQQRIDDLNGLGRWQFTHHPAQPGAWREVIGASRLDKRVDHHADVCTRRCVREQPS